MRVLVAGGSGMLGAALTSRLATDGHEVTVLTRGTAPERRAAQERVRFVEWNPDGTAGPWAAEVGRSEAIVNLSGAGIADRRWTDARKALIRSSRVLSTRSLVAAVRASTTRPRVFLQGSAVGYYGADFSDRVVDESFSPGDDFLGEVCVAWEAEAYPVTALECRLVIARTGVVLSPEGGVLARMKRPFQFFVGGPVQPGHQYFSWIHQDDWIRFIDWSLSRGEVDGAFNVTSPEPVTNRVFSSALARALGRPSWLPVPQFALRMLFGELADVMLIRGQRVIPRRASALGFTFTHPSVDPALKSVV